MEENEIGLFIFPVPSLWGLQTLATSHRSQLLFEVPTAFSFQVPER